MGSGSVRALHFLSPTNMAPPSHSSSERHCAGERVQCSGSWGEGAGVPQGTSTKGATPSLSSPSLGLTPPPPQKQMEDAAAGQPVPGARWCLHNPHAPYPRGEGGGGAGSAGLEPPSQSPAPPNIPPNMAHRPHRRPGREADTVVPCAAVESPVGRSSPFDLFGQREQV